MADYGQLIGGIASNLPAIVSGLNQTKQAEGLLSGLEATGPDKISPELKAAYDLSKANLNKGFTAGEENAFKQDLADRTKAAYSRALINSGGNQSQAIWAALKSMNLKALNDFYGQNNAIMRGNRSAYYGMAGNVANQENIKQNMFNQKLIAAGQGLAAGRYNTTNAATNMGNFIKSWYGMGGNNAQPEMATPQQPAQQSYEMAVPPKWDASGQSPSWMGLNAPASPDFPENYTSPYAPFAEEQ